MMRLVTCFLIFFYCFAANAADDLTHARAIARLSNDLVRLFAKRHMPDDNGAMGRNRRAYFHVRFQLGIHHLADYAVRNKDKRTAEHFVRALEYSFKRQNTQGGFAVNVPEELGSGKKPNRGDLASGVAFFLSSAGSGALALEQSDWFRKLVEATELRTRLNSLQPSMRKALDFLKREQAVLERYDAKAPNRLFFDALAFFSLGTLFRDQTAIESSAHFASLALQQQHTDGYFIEGGGFDSSYNGVACAIGYRLLLFQPNNQILKNALQRAIDWQRSRVLATGEITTAGNARVRPGGETFLGKEKGVDVVRNVEAFALAYAITENKEIGQTALRIVGFYHSRNEGG